MVSRLNAITDPRGKTTQFTYDSLNRVKEIIDALSNKTTFSYDENGNLLSVTDAKNQTVTYTYDTQDRLATRTDQLGKVESYRYDLNGNLIQLVDRKGQTTIFTYDELDRRTKAIYADGSIVDYTYDIVGRLISVSDSKTGTILFGYDNLDRLTKELTPQGAVEYTYDELGRRTSMTVSGGEPVIYQYDAASRLTQVAHGSQTVGLGYDAAGRRTSLTYPNGVTTTYTYDQASRLTNILHQSTSSIIENLIYTYDPAGNRISYSRNGPQAALPEAITAAYNAANQLIQWNNAAPNLTYDNNGNLTSQTDASGTTTYAWDARNRLVAINGPGLSASFVYDALGRRVSKTINGVTTEYQYDGNDIIAEISSGIAATYLRSLNIDEPFVRQSSSNEYYHDDALGSVLALTDQTGAVQTTYAYEPFGDTTITGSSANPFQYTGRENDGTGLYYYRARYYSPSLHRFLLQDPIEFLGGDTNLYAYARNNPCTLTDPLGLKCQKSYFQRVVENFKITNEVIPGLLAPIGLGLLTAGKVAEETGSTTIFRYILSGFRGITTGAATLTSLETAIGALGTTVLNYALVGVSFETGVIVGSLINAAIMPCQ